MLRICGITYVNTTNYGTCFQAYALQNAINKIIIATNVSCDQQFVALWHCNDHFSSKQNSIFYNSFLRQFKNFQENNISYIECPSVKDLPLLNNQFDAFICGSDVIWHPGFNHKLGLYYLDFAKKYKFSYAASFGKTDIQDNFLETAGNWISQLSEVSVREKSSVEIVKKYSGREARVIADPVILLKRQDWGIVADKTKMKKHYIFAYTTHPTAEYQDFLLKLSETTNLKVIKSAWITSMKSALKQGMISIQSPEKWLQQLRDADFVVTNSFHATVLSTLFHKKFFTIVHGEKNEGSNFRMFDYLSTIGLQDRMFSCVPEDIDLSEIDYTESDRIIKNMRDEAIEYLKNNLEAAYVEKIRLRS